MKFAKSSYETFYNQHFGVINEKVWLFEQGMQLWQIYDRILRRLAPDTNALGYAIELLNDWGEVQLEQTWANWVVGSENSDEGWVDPKVSSLCQFLDTSQIYGPLISELVPITELLKDTRKIMSFGLP